MNNSRTTLILGGNGKTGRRVAERLLARGLPVRIGSRSGTPPFDWNDPTTWADALRDVGSVYITYYPDLAVPGASDQVRGVAERAVKSGVRRLVLLAGRGEPQVLPSEQAVRDSGAEFTIIRAAFFCQNFSEGALAPAPGQGIVFPGGDVAEPFIDCDDIADVATAALTEDMHIGKTYELTGPRLVTFAEAAAEISRASGRNVPYIPVTFEEYRKVLEPFMPEDHVSFFIDLFRYLLDGHNAHVTDGVEHALRRKARDFRDYARDAAAAGAWAQ